MCICFTVYVCNSAVCVTWNFILLEGTSQKDQQIRLSHLSQVAESERKNLFSLVLEKRSRCMTLN